MKKNKHLTFAERARLIKKKYRDYEDDPISKVSMDLELSELSKEQEEYKKQMGMDQPAQIDENAQMKWGGNTKYKQGGPTKPAGLDFEEIAPWQQFKGESVIGSNLHGGPNVPTTNKSDWYNALGIIPAQKIPNTPSGPPFRTEPLLGPRVTQNELDPFDVSYSEKIAYANSTLSPITKMQSKSTNLINSFIPSPNSLKLSKADNSDNLGLGFPEIDGEFPDETKSKDYISTEERLNRDLAPNDIFNPRIGYEGLLGGLGAGIAALQKPEVTRFERATPNLINSNAQEQLARDGINTSYNNIGRASRETAQSSGQRLGRAANIEGSRANKLSTTLASIRERNDNINAGTQNQFEMFNTQIGNTEVLANEANQALVDSAQLQFFDYLGKATAKRKTEQTQLEVQTRQNARIINAINQGKELLTDDSGEMYYIEAGKRINLGKVK